MNTRRILGLALVVVAIGVAIVLHSSVGSAAKPGDVNEARVLSDAATGNNWLLNGRTFDAGHQRFLFRARQRRRRSLEWQGVRRHGRLPLGCHRCRNGTKSVGSNGL